ncbi:MAG: FKBP-type peptidyl-prolyl cis-trans isomerase [Candidatus Krumholzibacteriota bacterium]|nr:FKBP-type peptidyl-prolyl cis-trans isomerase [Candidatus Krumholzibacteriota bacterium]
MKRQLIAGALAALLSLLLAGCGGGEKAGDAGEAELAAGELNDASRAARAILEGEGAGKELVTTASGLQYVDLVAGEGESPRPGQICVTHATGWLLDGTKFWSSRDPDAQGRTEPLRFALGQGSVIAGWEEGVAGMTVGGVRRLAIPPELAYGERGRPPVIPPQATLIFEIELLAVLD